MNPVHLHTFLAARKHLNFTRAARELVLSQPAVSRQIHQLEAELGVRLFEQIGKALSLTDAGRTLAEEAESLLGGHARAAEAVRAHAGPERGSLRVGASTTPGLYLLPPVLGRFHARFPDVELDYRVTDSRSIEEAILGNEIDLGFVGARSRRAEILGEPVAEDRIEFFASPAHPLASRSRVSLASLFDHVCVVREPGSATRGLVEARLAAEGIAIGRSITLGSPEAIKAVVAGGLGFSFLSSLGLVEDFRAGRLKRLAVSGVRVERTIECIRHAEKRVSPTMAAFRESLSSAR